MPREELPASNPCLHQDTLKLVNCAGCRKKLVGRSMVKDYYALTHSQRARAKLPDIAYARINDRPYCLQCGLYLENPGGIH